MLEGMLRSVSEDHVSSPHRHTLKEIYGFSRVFSLFRVKADKLERRDVEKPLRSEFQVRNNRQRKKA